ncbi:MAG: alpha/beta hydrolase [Alphaproteobacteria bacterium]|nr:alpha/beta hydrolase [Alphaproteobacteria bacterium]MBL7097289.1 alpha/beta hydrolase [Alphaproteobacteria bacterium]
MHALRTADGGAVTGFLMRRGGEKTVVCAMHPREVSIAHYLAPAILKSGAAFWVQGSRTPNVDLRLEHELAVLDLAAGQNFLRQAGFQKTVLLGTSGGGPLAAFYIQQASAKPEDRLAKTPAGRASGLQEAKLPEPDALILISSHLGQGSLLEAGLDPSVTDEQKPFESDPELDPFSEKNGFKEPPASSAYSAPFLERYRAAQRRRVERIDAWARRLLKERAEARKSGADRRRASWSPIMEIWRTDADLRCWDVSLEPSPRAYGSLWGADPFKSNFGSVGFARLCTPESWLSTWSSISSNATMAKCAPAVHQPACLIRYLGDNSVFDSEARRLTALLGSSEKSVFELPGNHHGRAVAPGEPDGRKLAEKVCVDWLSDHGFL